MAREILFKAKRLGNGEWVEGLLTVMWGQYHMVNPNDENTAYPIDPETICQYTGLTDKNGNKIWENDIVTEDFRNEKGIVVFGEFESQVLKNIGFNIDWIRNISYRQDICWWAGKCEVIGNIFYNPELLEGENG